MQQINRNIALIRYQRFGTELLLLELANANNASVNNGESMPGKAKAAASGSQVLDGITQPNPFARIKPVDRVSKFTFATQPPPWATTPKMAPCSC